MLILCCAILAVSFPVLFIHAQSVNATLNGLVLDSSGAVIPGATVQAINDGTNIVYPTTTNDAGVYSLPSLPPGRYHIQVSKAGFKTLIKPDITLNVQDARAVNFTLEVGAVSQTVTVEGGISLVNTESAAVSTVVDRQFVENIPLNGRSFQALISAVPGVTIVAGAAAGGRGEFSVNGMRPEANYYTVDGVAANVGVGAAYNAAYGNGQFPGQTALGTTQSLASVDALEEFRISTSTYTAEFGRTPGAQISIQTRSGTNTWHGSAFDYLRNDVFDANNWFNDASNIGKTPERQNDFGATFGGPISIPGLYNGKDRSFFFFSYEGMRLRIPQAALTQWVPDTTIRQTAPAPLRPLLNAFPLPNGAEQTNDMALFTGAYSAPSSLNATSIRIDQILGSRWKLFGRFSDTPSFSKTRNVQDFAQISANNFNNKTLTIGATTALSSRLTNDLRFNTTWTNSTSLYSTDSYGGATPIQPQQLFSTPLVAGYQFAATFNFGTTPLLRGYWMGAPQRQWNVNDVFTHVHGSHVLTYGFDYRRLSTVSQANQLIVSFTYTTLAQILNNAAMSASAISWGSTTPPDLIFSNYSAFAQDEWRATNRLHLSLGLRWDVNPPPTNGNGPLPYTLDQITNLATAKLAPQGTPMWNTYYRGFAPRLGVVYSLHDSPAYQTVLRGGFGLFYDLGSNFAGYGLGNGVGFSTSAVYPGAAFPLTPQQSTLSAPSIASPYQALVNATDPNLILPRTWQWNVSVEQGLGANRALTMSYVGDAGRDLLALRYLNPASINPNFSLNHFLWLTTNGADSDYDAMQIQFQQRLSHGLQALAAYTWGHSIDNLSTNFINTAPPIRGNADFDIRHTLSAAVTYNLPGQYSAKLAQGALGGWSLDGRVMARSALPFLVSCGTIWLSGTQQSTWIPNVVSGVPIYLANPSAPGGRVVNFAAFSTPPAGQEGNEARNSLRGFNLWQVDLALRKDFPLHERLKFQFRLEAFNLFNHPNFGSINSSTLVGAAQFGRAINTLNAQLGGLNALYQTGGPRSLQLALKLIF
jgi:hypothetical protein